MKKSRVVTVITFVSLIMLLMFVNVGADFSDIFTSPNANPVFQSGFPIALNGSQVRSSSITLGDLNGDLTDDIIVGASDGKVHAYGGDGVKLWEYDTGDMAIEGKAAIGDVDQDGWNEVVVGAGSTFTPATHGGLYVLDHLGNLRCSFETGDFLGEGWRDGVYSSPALADLDENDGGKLEIVFGGWDGYVRVLNHDCSLVWEKFVRDTVWSSPAIGDVDKDGHLEIVIGVDSHVEPAFGTQDGGILHVYDGDGSELPGFPVQIDEVIYSSPALGDINGDGWLDIVVGTGYCWADPACAVGGRVNPGAGQYLNAWDHDGNYLPGWPKALNDTYAFASPALADLDEDGLPEVIVNTADGWVHALNADATYVPGWPVRPTTPAGPGDVVHFPTNVSPVVADVDGNGDLEVLLPSNWELVVWHKNGAQLTRTSFPPPAGAWDLSTNYTLNAAPAVGDVDGDGDLDVVVGGAYASTGSPGAIYAWDFSATTDAETPWPAFRRDSLNNARSPLAPALAVAPASLLVLQPFGDLSDPVGYLLVGNDGGEEFTWSATPSIPTRVSVAPSSGTVSTGWDQIKVTIDLSGLLTGTFTVVLTDTYDLGYITISGTTAAGPVVGSSVNVPVTLYVGDVARVFLPLVIK